MTHTPSATPPTLLDCCRCVWFGDLCRSKLQEMQRMLLAADMEEKAARERAAKAVAEGGPWHRTRGRTRT